MMRATLPEPSTAATSVSPLWPIPTHSLAPSPSPRNDHILRSRRTPGPRNHWLKAPRPAPLPQELPIGVLAGEGELAILLIDRSPSVTLCRPIKVSQEV